MNRREVVKLGVISAACLGCGGGDATPDAQVDTGATMCGPDLCVDLANPVNAALLDVGSFRFFTAPEDKLVVIRTGATEFAVLSRICTHNGCSVGYATVSQTFTCPCHGSKYAIDGAVINGPATRALRSYASTFDELAQTLTIALG